MDVKDLTAPSQKAAGEAISVPGGPIGVSEGVEAVLEFFEPVGGVVLQFLECFFWDGGLKMVVEVLEGKIEGGADVSQFGKLDEPIPVDPLLGLS